MTTHRAPEQSVRYPARRPAHRPVRPVERAVVAGLVLAVGAGLAWIGGMVYTIAAWSG
ncbi:morphogenic membrane protein MmpA [Streptomyces sp. BK79]|uniref:morphogenic membrane protein MmpA n=1 Tax=Streptomyces sp. BK79 TaxID=3350097 RepID=UPI00376FD238